MNWGATAGQLSERLTAIAQRWVVDSPAERADRARRKLLAAIGDHEPATLGAVAAAIGRGAPAVSRAVEALVKAGLVERTADPANRRRLAMRLTSAGRSTLSARTGGNGALQTRLERMAQSELRAVERAVEILERAS